MNFISPAMVSVKALLFILPFYLNIIHYARAFEAVEMDVDKKYILLWEPPFIANNRPFKYFNVGNKIFKKFNCRYTNCYIRKNYQKLNKIRNASNYDAIMFNGKYINKLTPDYLPKQRHPRQVFIFVQLEGADRFPVCPSYYDNFFNMTITYRLDSDIPWTYFKILTAVENAVVGPGSTVNWMPYEDMEGLNENDRVELETKSRIGAFVRNCLTAQVGLDKFVKMLSDRLLRLTRMPIDIYGSCRKHKKNDSAEFYPSLKKDYFFYLAMENSYDRDFVTKKLYMAQMHNTVPVVYGGADYSKFAPPSSYLNANGMTPNKLAVIMTTVMRKKYLNYFKWRNHYYYLDNHDMKAGVACDLCAKLNQDETRRKTYSAFRIWWNRRYEHPATCDLRRRHYPIYQGINQNVTHPQPEQDHPIKTILLWKPTNVLGSLGLGNKIFRNYNCKYDNCFISKTPNLEMPMKQYDAVMITSSAGKNAENIPKGARSEKQLYIFVQHESSEDSPVCSANYNNYFNMTMTYRLDSDVPWPYFDIMTSDNTVIGPKEDVLWLESKDMEPITIELKTKLRKKKKMVAWVVRNCTNNDAVKQHIDIMSKFVEKLNEELKRLGSKQVDVYGQCAPLKCPKNDPMCQRLINDQYMFYLSIENSVARDFVTDTLWRAYESYAVPVVFGGANYEKFAPPGSYMNAFMLGPKKLAQTMVRMHVNDRNGYYDFFKWRNHYSFQDNYYKIGQTTACNLCAKINEHKGPSFVTNFRSWWNEKWWSMCSKQ